MKYRGNLPEFLNEHGLTGYGVEVGVREGNFSRRVLTTWEGEQLVMVDPWRAGIEENLDSTGDLTQDAMDRWCETARKKTLKFGQRAAILRLTSEQAASLFEPGHFDFVYLDANHGYDEQGRWGIVQDLRLWWPLVRPGGLFSGHDYYLARRGSNGRPEIVYDESEADMEIYGVKRAVDEFAAEIGAEVLVTEDPFPSWYWIKSC